MAGTVGDVGGAGGSRAEVSYRASLWRGLFSPVGAKVSKVSDPEGDHAIRAVSIFGGPRAVIGNSLARAPKMLTSVVMSTFGAEGESTRKAKRHAVDTAFDDRRKFES